MTDTDRRVHRRRVLYIPGYDPMPPRRYRELYRREAAVQAAVSGHRITLGPRRGDRFGWHVEARIEGAEIEAEVEVLVWSDLVQRSMRCGIAASYLRLVRTAWIYISTGALFRLMRLRKGPVIAALYPAGMLLLQLFLAGLSVWTVATLSADVVPVAFAVGLGLPVGWAVLRWFRQHDGRFFVHYLLNDYAFTARHRGAYSSELEARLSDFSTAIAGALSDEVDEVLIVGHSTGAHFAVSALADLVRAGRVPANGPALSLLTLGQVVPMASFLPDAHRLRADLRDLSGCEDLAWVDVTAPGDGCTFALCDPVAVSGVAPAGQRWPLVLSAAFTRTLGPETWRRLRWRFFRLHFQYLCAFDRPGDYDYFAITAGPRTLGDRFAGRRPSRSRIVRPASGHTSTAA
ncbi:hypothetical protein [Tranquillimonas alkanivorans]|uniref:Alpha/beta hydrolase family protein n=1 Tax=Tranquillimonas alkanivorans TaxID=441119 RepID=A0A1I5RC24_9RHOB|nr:hypothetical protein [Tranquillimonas alkanivorans]SFP56084.1 hypothetical protein SAMN04488047_108103 [Tranquillimonas alkanivorans]